MKLKFNIYISDERQSKNNYYNIKDVPFAIGDYVMFNKRAQGILDLHHLGGVGPHLVRHILPYKNQMHLIAYFDTFTAACSWLEINKEHKKLL